MPEGRPQLLVRWLGHATVLVETGGVRLLTDPVLRSRLGPLRRHGPVPDAKDLDVDAVLISHGHLDHFDPRSLEMLPGAPLIVVPRGLAAMLRPATRHRVREVEDGEVVQVGGLLVEAVPARHWVTPGAPRATPLGYRIAGPWSIYFAGDTSHYEGQASRVGPTDIALLPVGTWGPHRAGPGHLGPRSAAALVAELAPRVAVPIHWGTFYPRNLEWLWPRPLREPGQRFAAHVRALAPATQVLVVRPGEALTFAVRGAAGSPEGATGSRMTERTHQGPTLGRPPLRRP